MVEARNRSKKIFENKSTTGLKASVDSMFWQIYDDAKAQTAGAHPNRALEKAFMVAQIVLAERLGDAEEGRRLRNWMGFSEKRVRSNGNNTHD